MEAIDRENKYAKLNFLNGYLITGAKHWYLKLSYSYSYIYYPSYFLEIDKIDLKIPVLSIKKMRIISLGIISIAFFLLAVMFLAFGLIHYTDPTTGQNEPIIPTATGLILGLILSALGFLYLRTKFGRLRVLQTSIRGKGQMLIYASSDIEELKSLRELIIKQQQTPAAEPALHQPPPLPKP